MLISERNTMIVPTHSFLTCLLALLFITNGSHAQDRLKVAVAGLSHDHVHTLLRAYKNQEVDILGIAEADKKLTDRYRKSYNLPDSLFFPSLTDMLHNVHPDIVLAYNAIAEHLDVAEVCLPLKVPLMVEKPLATTNEQAQRIARLSSMHDTPVFTNYETTWYESNQALKRLVDSGTVGALKKIMVKDGHQGPREIGCSEDFLQWLTDPEMNGGGALIDFGCYGANLMTWLMKGERPHAVTAVTRQLKPAVYPRVDDDATIILEYADGTTGIIQASWDWPYNIKDLQVFGENTSLHAVDPGTLLRYGQHNASERIPLKTSYFRDQLAYIKEALAGRIDVSDDLSSLSNNLIVVEILDAARESAKKGKRVVLGRK